jgi:ferritin
MGWSRNIEDAMNAQLGFELGSAYTYLSMAAYCEAESLPGFAHWMKLQYHEELEHAERFFTFIIDRGGRVRLEGIDKPKTDFATPLEIFESSLENEQAVTQTINELYTLTTTEQDYASQAFLNWFVTEQVEEEKMVTEIIDALKRAGQTGEALLLLDRELGRRTPEKG